MSRLELQRPHPGAIVITGKKYAFGFEKNRRAIGISYARIDYPHDDTGEEHIFKKGIPALNVRGILTAGDGIITARFVKSDIIGGDAIAGDIEMNRAHIHTKRLDSEGISYLEIAPGTPYLDIDFMPTVPFAEKIPQRVTSTIFTPYFQRRALQDYVKFLSKLEQTKKMETVDYVRCILPGYMAKLAMQRFGFLEQVDNVRAFQSYSDLPTIVWGEKAQLISHKPDVEHAIDQLRKAKSPSDEFVASLSKTA